MAGFSNNTFTEEDDARLIHAREDLGMTWKKVGEYVGKPWSTCQWRYIQRLGGAKAYLHHKNRSPAVEAAPSIAPTLPRRVPLHQQLGIKTQVVEVETFDRYQRRVVKITLPSL